MSALVVSVPVWLAPALVLVLVPVSVVLAWAAVPVRVAPVAQLEPVSLLAVWALAQQEAVVAVAPLVLELL